MRYFLGVDVGSSKTHVAIADKAGQIVGFGKAGAGNYEVVGYDGMLVTLQQGLAEAVAQAQIDLDQIAGAGFGIAGYDWPSQKPDMLNVLNQLNLACPCRLSTMACRRCWPPAKQAGAFRSLPVRGAIVAAWIGNGSAKGA